MFIEAMSEFSSRRASALGVSEGPMLEAVDMRRDGGAGRLKEEPTRKMGRIRD
jgi:hypothetical protein